MVDQYVSDQSSENLEIQKAHQVLTTLADPIAFDMFVRKSLKLW